MKNTFLFLLIISVCSSCRQPHTVKQTTFSTPQKTSVTKEDTIKKVKIKEPDLKKLVDELNCYLTENDSISPFQNYDPRIFKLAKSDVDSLLKSDNQEEKGKVPGWELNTYVQGCADNLLDKVLNHKAIVNYNLKDILNLDVIESADGKLFSLSYDANTGGTYKNRISFLHYRPGDGSVINSSPGELKPDGFNSIDMITAKKGTKYLLAGSVAGCGTCVGEYVQLLHYENNKPIIDFSYSIDRTGDEEGSLDYDSKQKKIVAEHYAGRSNEVRTDCDCNTDDIRDTLRSNNLDAGYRDSIDVSSKLKTGKRLKCYFYFDGETFVLNRKRSRMPE